MTLSLHWPFYSSLKNWHIAMTGTLLNLAFSAFMLDAALTLRSSASVVFALYLTSCGAIFLLFSIAFGYHLAKSLHCYFSHCMWPVHIRIFLSLILHCMWLAPCSFLLLLLLHYMWLVHCRIAHLPFSYCILS